MIFTNYKGLLVLTICSLLTIYCKENPPAAPDTERSDGPRLNINASQITLSGDDSTAALVISNSGSGILFWSVNEHYDWLDVHPREGTVKAEKDSVYIHIDQSGLLPGYISGKILIISSGGDSTVAVTLNVPERPQIYLDKDSIEFGYSENNKTFHISNTGTGELQWEISSNISWLSFSKMQGAIQNEMDSVVITVDKTGLEDGFYNASFSILSNSGTEKTITIKMAIVTTPGFDLIYKGQITLLNFEIRGTPYWTEWDRGSGYEIRLISGDETLSSSLIDSTGNYWFNNFNVPSENALHEPFFKDYSLSDYTVDSSNIIISNENARRATINLQIFRDNQYKADIKIINDSFYYYHRDFLDVFSGGIFVTVHFLDDDVNISGDINYSFETNEGWWRKYINKRIYNLVLKKGINFWVRKYYYVSLGDPRIDEYHYSGELPESETMHICVLKSALD